MISVSWVYFYSLEFFLVFFTSLPIGGHGHGTMGVGSSWMSDFHRFSDVFSQHTWPTFRKAWYGAGRNSWCGRTVDGWKKSGKLTSWYGSFSPWNIQGERYMSGGWEWDFFHLTVERLMWSFFQRSMFHNSRWPRCPKNSHVSLNAWHPMWQQLLLRCWGGSWKKLSERWD